MEKDERLLPLPKELEANKGAITYQEEGPRYFASYAYGEDILEKKFNPRDYLLVIYKRLPLIIALVLVITTLTALYMYRQPSIYQATAVLLIEPPKPKIQSKDTININFGYDLNYYNTQEKLLESPELMKEVVVKLGLYRNPDLITRRNSGITALFKSIFDSEKDKREQTALPVVNESDFQKSLDNLEAKLSPEEKEAVEKVTASLLPEVDVIQEEKTNLFSINVTNSNPELATILANTIAEAYIERTIRRETEGMKKSLEDITKSIDQLQENIAELENQRIAQMRESGLPLAEKGQDLTAGILKSKSEEWLNAEAERRKLEQMYEAALQAANRGEIFSIVSREIPNSEFISTLRGNIIAKKNSLDARLSEIDNKIKAAESERAALLARYTPENPKVKQIEATIQKLQEGKEKIRQEESAQIEQESKQAEERAKKEILTGLAAQLNSARKREAQAKESYLREVEKANQQGQAAMSLTDLTQKIETSRRLLNTYIQRQKELESAISSSRPNNVAVSTKASKPESPIGPPRNRNILISFIISLFLGIGLAFLLDYLDDSVRDVDDITRHLNLPTLALIPEAQEKKKVKSLGGEINGNTSTALITLRDASSPMAEAFRHLRTSLLFSSAGRPPQTILITSSQPSEGKTTIAVNTAVALAQAGADVVLIDCDLRRPRVHQHFSLKNSVGLTNYLSGDQELQDLLKSPEGLPKLKIITSGPLPPNPAELIGSSEMKALLNYLKTNFKHVIIDSPPAISFADAAILSTLVDGVVIVAMAGKSSMHLLKRFKQRMNNIGARIYGVVLNGISSTSPEYRYYGYYYGYESYKHDYEENNENSDPEISKRET